MTKHPHESELPPILGVDELAALLGTSVSSIHRAMARPGWIFPPLPRIDRRLRWSRDQVLAILTAVRAPSARLRA